MKLILNGKDEMTPLERSEAIFKGEDYDRVPIDPFLGEIKARYIGKNHREYWLSEDNLVEAEIAAFNKFGIDGMGVGPNAYGIAEAIGIKAHYPENGWTSVEKTAISSIDDIDNLDIITLDSGNLRNYYNATKRLREIGDGICPVGASLSGPLTLAGFCLGTDKLLKAMIKYPDKVDKYLEYIVECMKYVVDEFSALDISFSMADPIASTTMISPKMYDRFVFSPTQEICEYVMKKAGSKPSYHVCGNTKKIWDKIGQLKISMFSIDNEMDIHEACEYFSDKIAIAGNLAPVDIIANGTFEQIENGVIDCLEAGKKCKKGFVLVPGCNLPLFTTDDKIECFIDSGRKHSKKILLGR